MTTTTPQPARPRRWRFRRTRRTVTLAVALVFVATPAFASIIIQNYMQAEITASPACFTKLGGDDVTNSALVDFDGAGTTAVDGANLIHEKITLDGQIGDRVIFTDVVTYTNGCAEALDVQLVAAEVTAGTWADMSAQIWISNVAAPADEDPNIETADDWQDDHITVAAGETGAVADNTSGVVQVPVGGSIQGAFVISSGTAATGVNTVDWIAQATIVP